MVKELQDLGFQRKLISAHTGISIYKLDNMTYTNRARFTYPEVEAFNAYYDKCLELANVYGEKLSEYLATEQK